MTKRYFDYNSNLKNHSKNLKNFMTKQECKLWFEFLKFYPIKFYRQRIIGNYIVDFYCSKARLAVEIDGSQHYEESGIIHDEARTKVLNTQGIKVLRFSNKDVNENFEAVCSSINQEVRSLMGIGEV